MTKGFWVDIIATVIELLHKNYMVARYSDHNVSGSPVTPRFVDRLAGP